MTFRGRLTAFFAAIVLAPLVAGGVVVHALAGRQAVREADSQLEGQEIVALRAEDGLGGRVRLHMTRSLAVRAFRASPNGLEALRVSGRLGFLVVERGGVVAGRALGDPRFAGDTRLSPARLLGNSASFPTVRRRVRVTGAGDGVVVGGDYLDRGFLEGAGVAGLVVASGRVVASNVTDAPATVPASRSFDLPGGMRALCVCTGRPPSGIVLVARVRAIGLLPSLPRAVLALVVIGAILAGLLAFELARVLSKPHERALVQLEETEHQAMTDPLTGVPNRRRLEGILADEARRASRFRRPFSVLMVDVDRFKLVNDEHGHAVGDRVLQEVAERLGSVLRAELDTVARFGGEEFTVVLPETERDGAMVVAEKLRATVAASPFRDGFAVTVSIGVACRPEDGSTPDELLRAADVALYEAKRSGRDRVVAAR